MKSNAPYTHLSVIYELLTVGDYEKWSRYLQDLASANIQGTKGIDAGCGTGYFTRLFYRMGYEMSGFDVSEQMLSVAAQKAAEHGMRIKFTKQDAKNFKALEKADFVTAINDLVNYLAPEKVPGFFQSAYRALKKGGVLIFDISAAYKLRNILGNNLFAEDDDNFAYIWFNTLEENCVIMDLSIFLKQGEIYTKHTERHVQYVHSPNFIKECLCAAGFEVQLEQDFDTGLAPDSESKRIFFIGKKV